MKVEELDTRDLVPSVLWSPEKDKIRTPGLHLTDILYPMMEEMGEVPNRPDLTKDDLETYRAMGFIWEHIITDVLNRIYFQGAVVRPGEITYDGVILTPDGVLLHDPKTGLYLEEWKCTWTTSGKPPKKMWEYQIKAYCLGLGIHCANIRILYINGNWSPPKPGTRMYKYEFNDRDLWENWQEIKNYAKAKGMI